MTTPFVSWIGKVCENQTGECDHTEILDGYARGLPLFDGLERSVEIHIFPVPVYCEYNVFPNSFVFLNIRE